MFANPTRGLASATLLVGLVAAATPVHGSPAGPDDDPSETMSHEGVIWVEGTAPPAPGMSEVATHFPVPLQQTPVSVSVVSRGLFQQQDARLLTDALTNVAGVAVHSNFGVHDYFVIRGFDSLTGGVVLTDGAAEPEATLYHLYNVDRVEVLRGSSGFLYGANFLAGAANLVRKQPQAERFGQIDVSFGSFDTYRGAVDLNLGAADRELSFRLNATWEETDGYRDDRDGRVVAVNPAVSWRRGDATVTLNAEYVGNEFHPDAGLPVLDRQVLDLPEDRSYASPFDFSDQDVTRLRLDYHNPIGANLVVQNKAWLSRLEWETAGTLLSGGFPNAAGSIDLFRSQLQLDDDQLILGNRLELQWSPDSSGIRHQLLAGLELSRYSDEFTLDAAVLPTIDAFAPVETATQPLFQIPGQSQAADARAITIASYLIDRIRLNDATAVWLGVRFDHIDYEDPLSATDRKDDEFSPLAAFTWSPRSDLTLYGNAGRSFATPSTRVVGERKPEESRQVEFGVKGQLFDGRVNTNLAVYHLERRDIAIPDATGVTQTTGDQRSRGIEVELTGKLAAGVKGLVSYAYNDAELTEFRELALVSFEPLAFAVLDHAGNRPAFAPEHLARVWLSKGFDSGLELGGGLRYSGSQFIAENNRFEIDDYVTLDASIGYARAGWHWSVRMDNITDQDYLTRGFGASAVIPGRPFSIAGNARYRF